MNAKSRTQPTRRHRHKSQETPGHERSGMAEQGVLAQSQAAGDART